MREIWKSIPTLPSYEASNLGRVRSLTRVVTKNTNRWGTVKQRRTGKLLSQHKNDEGYPRVKIQNKSVAVHLLVLKTFVGPCPKGKESLHRDGDSGNAKLKNLKWGTHLENVQDCYKHGTMRRSPGEANGAAKLTESQVRAIRKSEKPSIDLAIKYGVTYQTIYAVRVRRYWKHII